MTPILRHASLVAALALVGAIGCDDPPSEESVGPNTEAVVAPPPQPETPSEPATGDQSGDGLVTLSEAGLRFDPPLPKSRVPEGAYYCDMGTVHFAALARGTGQCPLCRMQLQHMEADEHPIEEESEEAHEHEAH